MIRITDSLEIPEDEVRFTASRSGGPGGQNVNKVSSKVTLHFDVVNSTALTPEQRSRIHDRLAARIGKDGILQVTSQRTRSQERNRVDALSRFTALLQAALQRQPRRVRTAVPAAARDLRVQDKKKRAATKRLRSVRDWE